MTNLDSITTYYSNVRNQNRRFYGDIKVDFDNQINSSSESNSNGVERRTEYTAVVNGETATYIKTRFWGHEGNNAEYEYGSLLVNGEDIT